MHAYQYQGYWEDIGTIRSFYEANLDLCAPLPKFNFYDATAPIFTHARYLPGTKIIKSRIEQSVIADGCIINDAVIEHSLVGRARADRGGGDDPRLAHHGRRLLRDAGPTAPEGAPPIGIGQGTTIEHAIVDKNARIGDSVRISPEGKPATSTGPTSTCGTASW